MTEPTTHTLDVPGAVLTYDVRRNDAEHRAGAAADRVADGRRRLRHAGGTLRRPHGRDLRPARRGAQQTHRRRNRVHARRARRRPAPADRGAGRRAGRPLRQQRWRGERARPGRPPPRAGPDARRARAAGRPGAAGSRGGAGRVRRTSTRPTSAAASGRRWRSSSRSSATRARSRPTSPTSPRRTRRCSGCRPRTTAPATTRCSAQNLLSCTHYEPDFDALRAASTRIVVAAGAESEASWPTAPALAVAERLGTTPVTFPSDHGGFLGGEYGQTGEPDAFAATLREVLAERGLTTTHAAIQMMNTVANRVIWCRLRDRRHRHVDPVRRPRDPPAGGRRRCLA